MKGVRGAESLIESSPLHVQRGGLTHPTRYPLEVHTRPEAGAYQDVRSFGSTETVAVVIDGRELGVVAASDLLP